MHHRLGSATLLQLAFPREGHPNFPWEKSHWDSCKKKKKSKSNHVCFAACSQILDVERMLAKSATPAEILAMETHQQQMENHPVIRTLYDHAEVRATLLSAHCLTRQKLEPSSYPHKL